jgi:hypothetical protein
MIVNAHSLSNSLVAEGMEGELGLVVVDEVHMQGRGANLSVAFLAFESKEPSCPLLAEPQVEAGHHVHA